MTNRTEHTMTHERNDDSTDLHHRVQQDLPWYVNDTLDARERSQVQAHLQSCHECRVELQRCQQLAQAVERADNAGWQPSADHRDSLMRRLDARPERVSDRVGGVSHDRATAWGQALATRLSHWRRFMEQALAVPRWVVLAPAALSLVLGSALLLRPIAPESVYRTLTDSSDSGIASDEQPRVQVIFDGKTTQFDIKALLLPLNARIVDGPTLQGRYTLAISLSEQVPTVEAALERLRASDVVEFAQP